jgi:hypothetical protein
MSKIGASEIRILISAVACSRRDIAEKLDNGTDGKDDGKCIGSLELRVELYELSGTALAFDEA